MAHVTEAAPKFSRSRRRGEVLERALYEATLAELSQVGYRQSRAVPALGQQA
jgi:hypothetical protein